MLARPEKIGLLCCVMFIEPLRAGHARKGWIEVICGCMFSGKTEELIRRLKRARIANQRVEIYKPKVDTRYHETHVVSHDSNEIHAIPLASSANILLLHGECDVIGIDEAQFFDPELPEVCEQLANKGIRVIIAALDMDSNGQPFGPVPDLMARAEYVTKVHAICQVCGDIASYSYRKVANTQKIFLGEQDSYEARCRKCFFEGENADKA